jgi:hypothetical protein
MFTSRPLWAAVLRKTVILLGVIVGLACPRSVPAESSRPRIEEDFGDGTFDKVLWALERVGARADPVNQRLRILVPPGPGGRSPVAMQAQFRIEGDFAIRADYAIASLRKPEKEWINIEIFIEGSDGRAAVIRSNHAKEGSGYSLWYEPASAQKADGAWKQVAAEDASGSLCLERTADRLRFQIAGPADQELRELGSVAFGKEAITGLAFRVVVPETRFPVEVSFDSIRVEADRLVEPPRPSGSMFGRAAWFWAIVLLLIAGAAAVWYWKSRPSPANR